MKTFAKWIAVPAMFAALLWSCKKDENKDYFLGGTNPVLSASDTTLKFVPADSNKTAVTFSWTNPNYKFTTGISSQNVNYTLQIDTLGANFTNPKMFTLSISSDLTKAFTVTEINSDIANAMGLATGISHNIQVRLVASLGSSNAGTVYSNVLQYKVTPYAPPPLITPPSSGTLFVIGDASPNGWTNPIPASNLATQQFKQVSATEYKITIALAGGGQYKFIGNSNNYNLQYATKTNADATLVNGGSFTDNPGGNNILAPATSGNYLIDVNFQTGTFTVTKQ